MAFMVLIFIILFLTGIIAQKAAEEHARLFELKSFKEYADALHQATSESEVYNILFAYIGRMPLIRHAALYYYSGKPLDEGFCQKITKGKAPLCSMPHKACPLIQSETKRMEVRIGKSSSCRHQLPAYKSGSYVCIPIIDAGHRKSILQVYSTDESLLDRVNISNLKFYTDIARAVIHSRRAIHALSRKASTDKLTKVYNRSFLEPYLENQIEAASLSNQPLSAMTIDIDHFKRINDTYGHSAGDHVLVLFTDLVLKCIRKTDLLARYGGDEFIAVLPSTDTETAQVIAERIRQAVASAPIALPDGMEIPSISCSIGISTYPFHCSSMDELLKTSDMTLYKAKQAGRNCVRIYGSDLSHLPTGL
jgi:diguanylate cyclase (GGDEF)-like protein